MYILLLPGFSLSAFFSIPFGFTVFTLGLLLFTAVMTERGNRLTHP